MENIPYYLLQFAVFVAVALCVGIFLGYLIWGGTALDLPGDLQLGDESEAVADLRAQVEAKDGEISRLRKRLKRAHADLEARHASSGDGSDMQALVEARNADVAALTHQVSVLHHELDDARRTADAARRATAEPGDGTDADVTALMEELDAARQERRRLDGEVLGLRQSLDDQVRYAGQLADALESARRAEAELAAAGMASGGDADAGRLEMAEAIERALAQADAATVEADRASAALLRAEAEVASLRLEVDELRESGVGAGDGSTAEVAAVARLQAELERSRASAATWRERVNAAEDEVERLAGELAESSARLDGAAQASSQHDEQLRSFTAQLEAALAEADAYRRQLADRPAVDESVLRQLEEDNDALTLRVNELGAAAAALRGRAERGDAMEAEVERLSDEVRRVQMAADQQVQSVRLELADARLRADEAHHALAELSSEFLSFRDTVMRQQSTVTSIAERLDRARGALGGRAPGDARQPVPATPSGASDDEPDDLMTLPGATDTLIRDLHELGVTTFEEIGSWDATQLERYEEALDDADGVMRNNGWVMAARRRWEERTGTDWSDRSDGRVRP